MAIAFAASMQEHAPGLEARRRLREIRDARIAAGCDLESVARRSRIPVVLLAAFERGDLSGWPRDRYGRTELVRYARAAGLDPVWVVEHVLPILDSAIGDAPPEEPHIVEAEGDGRTAITASRFDGEEVFASEEPDLENALRADGGSMSETRVAPEHAVLQQSSGLRTHRRQRNTWLPTMMAVAAAAVVCLAALGRFQPGARERPGNQLGDAASRSAPAPYVAVTPAVGTANHELLASERTGPGDSRAPVGEPGPSVAKPSMRDDLPGQEEQRAASAITTDVAAGREADAAARPMEPRIAGAGPTLAGAHPAEGVGTEAVTYSPAFAPTGETMYFQREMKRGTALMRADTDTDGRVLHVATVIDDGAHNFHVRPSPDERWVAFDSDRDGVRGVYVADRDGRRARRVSGDGYAAVPSWSPDGTRLAFIRAERLEPHVWNLWQLTLASGELHRVTSYPVGQLWGASWFPDGRRVAYSHENALVVLDLETGVRQVYRSPRPTQLVRTPAVSPSGREILFQVFRDGVWLLNVSSGATHRVLDDPSAEEYAWAPDGRMVAYHSRRSGRWGLWLAAAH